MRSKSECAVAESDLGFILRLPGPEACFQKQNPSFGVQVSERNLHEGKL